MLQQKDLLAHDLLAELEAARRVAMPFLHKTPLVRSRRLGDRVGADLYFKLECMQKTGAFKVRGMMNKMMRLTPTERASGVVSFSSGNAALGLAYAAAKVGTKATVFVYHNASRFKIAAAREYGAELVLVEDHTTLRARAETFAEETSRLLVHPYDDRDLMVGHASAGLEIFEDLPSVGTIVTAIGGGGMAGGLALATRAWQPDHAVRLIGVEPEGADQMRRSLAAGEPVAFEGRSVAEGLSPPTAGRHCFDLIKQDFAEHLLVSDAEIVAAMVDLMTGLKIVAEPSGTAALAAVLSGRIALDRERPTVVLVSGGNIDPDRLKHLL